MYADLDRIDDALTTLDAAASTEPRNQLKYQLAKSEVLARVERNHEAIAIMDSALASNPDETSLLYSRAMLKEKVGDFDAMEADLRRVLELQPNNSAALNALGYTFANRNQRLDEAWELIERAYQINPTDPAIIDSMGWIKYRMGQPQVALDFLRQAYSAFKDQEIAAHLGEVLWILGEKEEATRIWRQALQDHPDSKVLRDVMQRFLPE
jgi:tetratricopeptide (TPR) repeat protein